MKAKDLYNEKIFEPWGLGIHHNISDEEYHSIKAVSSSSMKLFSKSPLHFLHYLNDQQWEETPSMIEGRRLHKFIFQPKQSENEFIIAPEDMTNKRTKKWREFSDLMKGQGKEALLQKEYDKMFNIRDMIYKFDFIREAILGGKSELTVFAKCPKTGLMLKGRIDFASDDNLYILDYKTTQEAAPDAYNDEGHPVYSKFTYNSINYHYHVQAAFYRHLMRLQNRPIQNYCIIAQEKTEPFMVCPYLYGENALEKGEELFDSALEKINHCVKNNSFPGYASEFVTLHLTERAYGEVW